MGNQALKIRCENSPHRDDRCEMRFSPTIIAIRLGRTIHFTHGNRGSVMHEMVVSARDARRSTQN